MFFTKGFWCINYYGVQPFFSKMCFSVPPKDISVHMINDVRGGVIIKRRFKTNKKSLFQSWNFGIISRSRFLKHVCFWIADNFCCGHKVKISVYVSVYISVYVSV